MKVKWFKNENQNFERIKNIPGVYVISSLNIEDDKYYVDYVGQSENLHDRIAEHFYESEDNIELKKYISKSNFVKVSYAYIDKKYLNAIEQFLCYLYNPPCNKISPPGGNQISCNLPDVKKYSNLQKLLFINV